MPAIEKGVETMKINSSEKGQALIIITLAVMVLFGFAALAIDGSMAFSDKRHAQSAADTAALAGALAYTKGNDITTAAQTLATTNGYDNGVKSDITITATSVPSGACPGNAPGKDIKVDIVSYVNTTFTRVIGRSQITNAVTATSRGCAYTLGALFNGNAIVALNPSTVDCGIDTGNSNYKSWNITGGGVFSNGCLEHPNGTLTIPDDKCITSVGNANTSGGGDHDCVQENQTSQAYAFPDDITPMMPRDPCTGAITSGRYAGGGKVPSNGQTTFNNDIFCISDFSTLNAHIVLSNSTLYVTDTSFNVRFNGGGDTGFFGTASTSGEYKGFYMIIKLLSKAAADNCDQYFDYRGNGNLAMTGTILAPSTCLDYRGNSTGASIHSQMIFYDFTSNGNASIDVNYQANENYSAPVDASIALYQ
jgi:Flp pilus assembly protein TadG